MNQIIDVEYEVVDGIENKSIEELAKETNQLYAQAEAVANVSLMYMAQAGARLEVIKGKLPHGEFEEWCKNNLSFSKSKAEKMMKLNQKLSDKNSFLAKTESITDIGITKIWALLSAPDDVAEEVINNPESADMSTREFKEEIRKLKQEKDEVYGNVIKLEYFDNIANVYDDAVKPAQLFNLLYTKANILYKLVEDCVLNESIKGLYLFFHNKSLDGKPSVKIITDALKIYNEKMKEFIGDDFKKDFTKYNDDFIKLYNK